MRRAAWLWPLLGVLVAPAARADLVARSRNSVIFVESTREGEEWEAFRLVDPRAPATYQVRGPGRVLLRVRTLPRAEPVDAIAAVLVDEQVTLTLRVPATVDEEAHLTDSDGQPSLAKLYLLKVPEGTSRVTVRHSEGPPLLIAARFAPPLEAQASGGEVPLVAPRARAKPSVPRVGALERGGGALASGPEAPDPEARPIEPPLPDGDAHTNSATVAVASPEARPPPKRRIESHPAFDERLDLDPRPTGRPAALLFEARAGVLLDGVLSRPGLAAGVDFRGALFSASNPRRLDVGVSVDIGHARGDEIVRLGGAPVDVAGVTHTFGALSADVRYELFVRSGVTSVYASGGGGVLLGRARLSTTRGETSAGTTGFLGGLRLGATLGSEGSRPFLELRGLFGRLESEVLRPGPDAARGDPVGWYALGATVGWRFELGYPARRKRAD